MRVAWLIAIVALGACSNEDYLPAGPVCPPPGPWTWTDLVDAPGRRAWMQTRAGCGFPDQTIEYRIWAQTDRGRTLVFEGEMEQKWWRPPVATDDRHAIVFGGKTCSLDGAEVRCR